MAVADHGFTSEWVHSREDADFEPIRTLPATILQVAVALAYLVLTVVLPMGDDFFKTSNHITVLHAGSWLLIGICAVYIELEVRKLVKHGYIVIFEKTQLLAHAPFVIATLLNFVLLTLLGLDTWIETETGDDPISVRVLQVAAGVELLAIMVCSCRYLYLIRLHNRTRGPPDMQILAEHARRTTSMDESFRREAIPAGSDSDSLLREEGPALSDPMRSDGTMHALVLHSTRLNGENERLRRDLAAALQGKIPQAESHAELAAENARLREQNRQGILDLGATERELSNLRTDERRLRLEVHNLSHLLKQEQDRCEKLTITMNIERSSTMKVQDTINELRYMSATEVDTSIGAAMAGLLGAGSTRGSGAGAPPAVAAAAAASGPVAGPGAWRSPAREPRRPSRSLNAPAPDDPFDLTSGDEFPDRLLHSIVTRKPPARDRKSKREGAAAAAAAAAPGGGGGAAGTGGGAV